MYQFDRRAFLRFSTLGLVGVALPQSAHGGAFFFKRMFSVPPRDTSFITPNKDFYLVQYAGIPRIETASWKLPIYGQVGKPTTLTYADFLTMPSEEAMVTLKCIDTLPGGSTISNAVWQGPSLRDILLSAEVKPGAVDLVLHAADGYSDSIPIERVMEGDVLLAHTMNGVALPIDHGYPVRVIVPGLYGIKNVKWLTGMEVTHHDFQGYWQQRGWTDVGRIKTFSRIDRPGHYQEVNGSEIDVQGIAFAGSRGVSGVEISTTGGKTWDRADIVSTNIPTAWILWRYRWVPQHSGSYTLVVRAYDQTGAVQTSAIQRAYPDGSSGLHTILVLVNQK